MLQAHQLLHGYRNGHELLAGSTKLPSADAELVARLSDLSGTLQSDVTFYPYVTIYPLPSGKYYGIARTWLDRNAPRSGCVLTRTALVPMLDWREGAVSLPDVLNALFMPHRDEVHVFQQPLLIDPTLDEPMSVSVPTWEIEAFVGKYFGEGIRPIVWLRDSDANALLASISRILWPELRGRFAACTLSLQIRTLRDGPFDLLFAPTAVYSRFSKVARENLIESSNVSKSRQGHDQWISQLAGVIASTYPEPVSDDWRTLGQALSTDPTSVRWLYLLNDLRARTEDSPTAALGAMDVVERLCPEPTAQDALKQSVVESALLAADKIGEAGQALSFLQLICERLSHDAYSSLQDVRFKELSAGVARRCGQALEQALASYEELLGRTSDGDRAAQSFRRGVIHGLVKLGADNSAELAVLHKFDRAGTDIVPSNCEIGQFYLRSAAGEELRPSQDISRWLRNHAGQIDWVGWASMLSLVAKDTPVDDELFGECLTRLDDAGAGEYLNRLVDVDEGSAVAAAVTKYLLPSKRSRVRDWAFSLGELSSAGTRIAGLSFELSSRGLAELLEYDEASQATKSGVLIQFLARLEYGRLPEWLSSSLIRKPDILLKIADAVSQGLAHARDVSSRIFRESEIVTASVIDPLVDRLSTFNEGGVADDLSALLLRSILAATLREERDVSTMRVIDEVPQLTSAAWQADGGRLAALFSAEVTGRRASFVQAWRVLAKAPESLFRSQRIATMAITTQLLRQYNVDWSKEAVSSWGEVLDRARSLCEPRFYMRHCVQALVFSYANSHLPLSSLVHSSFPTVYKAVFEGAPYQNEADGLLSYDWDRAKGLRRNLVDCFYQSNRWPAGDLALAAADSFGLRKLFRRVWRKWAGEEYVARMIADLRRRSDPQAAACANELMSYYERPHFYEAWD